MLRWDIQQERTITIPKSRNPEHIRSNFDVFGFSLDDSEMAAISALTKTHMQRVRQSGGGRAGLGHEVGGRPVQPAARKHSPKVPTIL